MAIAWHRIEFDRMLEEPINLPKDRTVYVCVAGEPESIDSAGWSEEYQTFWKNGCGLQFATHWAEIAQFEIPEKE